MTVRLVSVPTEVMFGWEAFVTDPAVFAKLTVPVRLATCTFVRAFPPPIKKGALTFPVAYRPVRVPTEVILGWDAFVTLWAVPTVLTLAPFIFEIPEPLPLIKELVIEFKFEIPETFREVRVPTEVMLGWVG